MKVAFVAIALLHAAIHLLGFAKGVGMVHLPQLQLPISRSAGWLWLLAAVFISSGAGLLLLTSRFWGVLLLLGISLSQVLIFRHFADAKFGTIANLLLLAPALINALDLRSTSLRSEYAAATRRVTAQSVPKEADGDPNTVLGEPDVAHLPDPVQRYLRRVGAIGKPKVHTVRARMSIQIRGAADEPWMDGKAEQYNSLDEGLRYFFLEAKRGPLTFDVAHLLDENGATMRARVLGLFSVMDDKGPELTRSETVTLLNDMCLLAPSTLIDARLKWKTLDDDRVEVSFTRLDTRVSAVLTFSNEGDLVNFVSGDRSQSDGKTSAHYPWWTPLSDYRSFGDYRLASVGEAQWEEPSGLWTYARIHVLEVEYNVNR